MANKTSSSIFVSTSCLKGDKRIRGVLDEYNAAGIKNIELGAMHPYEEGIVEFLKEYRRKHDGRFTIHAFFPPEKTPFIVNLASQNPEILKRSRMHIMRMIDTAKEIGARMCSFHAGYLVDPGNVGVPLDKSNPYDYEKAYSTFISSLKEICSYAKKNNVKVAMEPNEMSLHNLVDGKNKLLLMCELHEIKRLYKDLEKEGINNLGILLDLGHLKVAANNLGFDAEEFIEGVKERVIEIHMHDNDGTKDQHKPLNSDSWALEVLKKHKKIFKQTITTLEPEGLYMDDIKKQIGLLEGIQQRAGV